MTFEQLTERASAVVNPRVLSAHADAGSVGAAIESASGAVYVGVCLDMACGVGFCAEHAAAAAMVTAGESRIAKVVAVGKAGVMPPCGRCREFLRLLAPENLDAQVLVQKGVAVPLKELLPYPW